MRKYLRAKTNGMIFDWNEVLLNNPDIEEITEQDAYPERFAPVDLKTRTPVVDLTVNVETVAPATAPPELLAEASKPFGGRNSRPVKAPVTGGLSFGDI